MRAFVIVALAACGSAQTLAPTPTPTPTQTQTPTLTPAPTLTTTPACKSNDECAMSSFRACCSPCGLAPFADFKSEVDALKRRCALVECATREPQECKPTESIDAYHAECQNAACVAVRNAPPQTPTPPALLTSSTACSRDTDCTVTNFGGCCSSCQAPARATSNRELESEHRRCTIVDCAMDTTPRCQPVVDAALYHAACRAGTCAAVKR